MTTKAVRATITLGNIELDVFQLPDGGYRYGYEFLASLIDRDKSILSDKKSPYSLQSILGKDKTDWNTKLTGISKGYVHNGLSDGSLMSVFGAFASLGCQPAISLLVACGIEALERRADSAFGILRTEQERNERFQIRFDGILSRHFWTDSISEYIKTHPDLSDNYKRWVFHNVSDTVNLALFGLTAKKVREHYQLEKGMSVREMLNTRTLKLIDTIENAAAIRVLETDSEPSQAIKDVMHLLGIEPNQDRL